MNQLHQNLQKLHDEISQLVANSSTTHPITLVAVSKTFSTAMIKELYNYGQVAFAESYVNEFKTKVATLSKLNISWHFIGNLQSNKINFIAQHASWVQSLTTIKHAKLLNAKRPRDMEPLNVLIEVNISHEPTKHGLRERKDILALANYITTNLKQLKLRGIMGMAANTSNQNQIKAQFNYLYNLFNFLKDSSFSIDTLSMGMSNDYPLAIECGANMLRIGSQIFGARDYAAN
jgi:hypothetical protein